GTGTVTVSGVNSSGEPSTITASLMWIGEAGVGELTIEDGGFVEAGAELTLGKSNKGQGGLTVRGGNPAISLPSKLNVELLSVGNRGPGSMLIEGHAEVSSQIAFLGSLSPFAPSEVSIIGSRALWKVEGGLEVGSTDLKFDYPSQSIV